MHRNWLMMSVDHSQANESQKEKLRMEQAGLATRLRRGYGAPGIEGKAARVAASECGQRASFNYEVEGQTSDIRHQESQLQGGERFRIAARAATASPHVFRLASADLLRENFNHLDVAPNNVRAQWRYPYRLSDYR